MSDSMHEVRRARLREDIANYVARHDGVTVAAIRTHLEGLCYEVSAATLTQEIRSLKEAGEICIKGATGATCYHTVVTRKLADLEKLLRHVTQTGQAEQASIAAYCEKHGLGVAAAFELLNLLEGR